jgi:hypothetical protein
MGRQRIGRLRVDVEQRGKERDCGQTTGDRVVQLEKHAESVAAETGDEPKLPERSVAKQTHANHPLDSLDQLRIAGRWRESHRAYVSTDVEARVVDLYRAILQS